MMILAGGIRAVLRSSGPRTTFHLALDLDAPSARVGALMARLEANCEVYMDAEGRWRLWGHPTTADDAWAMLRTLRAADADQETVGWFKAATFVTRYGSCARRPDSGWPASCQDCPYNDGQVMCQCV